MKQFPWILIMIATLVVLFLSLLSFFFWEDFILSDPILYMATIGCLVLYFLGYSILIFGKNAINLKKLSRIILIQAALFLVIGFLFRFWHLPYSGLIRSISFLLLIFLYAPLHFNLTYNKWKLYTRSRKDALLLCIFDLLGIVIALFAIFFKTMHWPGAGVLILLGVLILSVSIFAWNQKFKNEIIARKHSEDKLHETLKEVLEQKKVIEGKNELLEQQNEEIRTINYTLNEQKNLIEEKNTELEAQNEEIAAQRDMLSFQNTAINESILYAKRIQTAVLPQQAYIDEILPENFILYKPRNVVSGDFYWVRQVNQYIVIAVADCTGHGVPGAIMSMLGISFLGEIIQKREITQPAKALNELRRQVKQALRQTGKQGEAEDGMDIALVSLDTKTRTIQFAGAMNPIYLISQNKLEEIKPDRMPVGFYPNEKAEFTNHEIQLKTNDLFYLFSDGYMDQFGGENGMKFNSSQFQRILLGNHDKPMQIQKEKLEQELTNWMKGYEQTDDILVMGVRV
jgi:serine phosphatase RsbU (regulator of sigma subunit)